MSDAAVAAGKAFARSRYGPALLGLGSFVAFIVLVEVLIRVGLINRFIVPMPSDIIAAFPRVIEEEQVLHRFVLTATEALSASILVAVLGVAGGVLLHQLPFAAAGDRDLGGGDRGRPAGADLSALSRDLRPERAPPS